MEETEKPSKKRRRESEAEQDDAKSKEKKAKKETPKKEKEKSTTTNKSNEKDKSTKKQEKETEKEKTKKSKEKKTEKEPSKKSKEQEKEKTKKSKEKETEKEKTKKNKEKETEKEKTKKNKEKETEKEKTKKSKEKETEKSKQKEKEQDKEKEIDSLLSKKRKRKDKDDEKYDINEDEDQPEWKKKKAKTDKPKKGSSLEQKKRIADQGLEEDEMKEDRQCVFQLTESTVFERMIQPIEQLADDGNLNFLQDGLSINTMDRSHAALIVAKLPREDFHTYNITRNTVMGVKLKTLKDCLGRGNKNSVLTMMYVIEKEEQTLMIQLSDTIHEGRVKTFFIKLMDIDPEEIDASRPDTHRCKIYMPCSLLKQVCSEGKIFGDQMKIEVSTRSVKFTTSGDSVTAATNRFKNELTNEDDLEHIKHDDERVLIDCVPNLEISETFSIKYLVDLLNCKISSSHSRLAICIDNEQPLLITFKVGDTGGVRFYMAPMVDDNEQDKKNEEEKEEKVKDMDDEDAEEKTSSNEKEDQTEKVEDETMDTKKEENGDDDEEKIVADAFETSAEEETNDVSVSADLFETEKETDKETEKDLDSDGEQSNYSSSVLKELKASTIEMESED